MRKPIGFAILSLYKVLHKMSFNKNLFSGVSMEFDEWMDYKGDTVEGRDVH